jgi:hypothetical protein
MVDSWLKSSSAELAGFYSLVLEYHRDYGYFAPDPVTQEDLLVTRAELERRKHLTAEMKKADEIVLRQGVHASYDYTGYGSEWPLHLLEIQAGKYPLDALPPHLQDLAQRLYYSKAPA